MIEIINVSKNFDELEALKNVTMKVSKGLIYGLVGSNGAGKTTLLKTITGIYVQNSGEILIDKQKVYENTDIKRKVIFIQDIPYFFPQFSIKDMADFYKDIYPDWNEERFVKLKEAFNIDINKKLHKMSKGMQRQVAFWLTLSMMPEYLILDEPFDGLDPVMRQKVKNLIIQDVADREMTVLISSHNLRELEDLCDSIGILHQGSLILEKDLDDLKADISKVQVAFKDGVPEDFLKGMSILYKDTKGSVNLFIIRYDKNLLIEEIKKYNPLILDILPLTLEEIFIYEMGDVGYEINNIIL